jgi:hypothetical protein
MTAKTSMSQFLVVSSRFDPSLQATPPVRRRHQVVLVPEQARG